MWLFLSTEGEEGDQNGVKAALILTCSKVGVDLLEAGLVREEEGEQLERGRDGSRVGLRLGTWRGTLDVWRECCEH